MSGIELDAIAEGLAIFRRARCRREIRRESRGVLIIDDFRPLAALEWRRSVD